jgi:hypothetical protein
LRLVVGEGAAPSRHAYLAFTGVYKTPLHGWCYPPICGVVLWIQIAFSKDTAPTTQMSLTKKNPRSW